MDLYKVQDIMSFLELIHPFIKENVSDRCIELRSINRINKKQVLSCKIWDKTTRLSHLKKYLDKNSISLSCCYYSVFSLKRTKEKYINSNNSYSTQVLVSDFDNISKEDMNIYYQKLKSNGLDCLLINSGNGYQLIFLLDKETKNKNIFKKLNNLLYVKGFPVDLSIQNSSQIMRLPFTYNCKEYDEDNVKHTTNPIKKISFVEEYTEQRYSLDTIFDIINSFETKKIIKEQTKINKKDLSSYSNDDYLSLFSKQEWDKLDSAIKNILITCEKGYRNNALITLITYFKNKGLSDLIIKSIIKIWTNHTIPVLDINFADAETERLLKYHYSSIENFYNYSMVERFGSLEINFEYKNKESLFISNDIFKKYKHLKGTSVKLYLLLLYENTINKHGLTRDDCIQKLNISLATLNRHLKELKKNGLVRCTIHYKKNAESYIYYAVNNINKNKIGYTVIGFNKIADILYNKYNSLSSSEIKVLLYLYSKMNIVNRTWESQYTIGKNTGFGSTSICIITSNLTLKGYINKQHLLTFFKDNNKTYSLEKIDKQLYHFIINNLYTKANKWKTNCIYWVQEFLEKNVLATIK